MYYKIESYNFNSISREKMEYIQNNIFQIYYTNNLGKYSDKQYLYWDKLKYKELPVELESHEELWLIIKMMRMTIPTFVTTQEGEFFRIGKPNFLDRLLHELDLSLGGNFLGVNLTKKERQVFLQNGMMEEAISSSQIEGAMTTSEEARAMIANNKKPQTQGEKMVINNYKAMMFVKDELIKQELTRENLLELQSILTTGTVKEEEKDIIGRWRRDDDNIVVQDAITGKIYHKTPKEEFLQQELEKLLLYANDREEQDIFVHPFVKACILHFWIGYLHPFCDGNGRTARAIFYWYLLKHNYWGFSYIPLSKVINESKEKYKNAYLYSEQDDYDLTYFLVFLTDVTQKAFTEFGEFIKRKKQEREQYNFNHLAINERQEKLLIHFIQKPESYVTLTTHMNYFGISNVPAKKDLIQLVGIGILQKRKVGTYVRYFRSDAFDTIVFKK